MIQANARTLAHLSGRENLMNMANERFESIWDELADNSTEAADLIA